MNEYIGFKNLKAKPMTRGEYNRYRGWELPANEDPADDGYLVEYIDGGKPNDSMHEGYISWSPADVFERSYRPTQGMTFGQALEAMKMGKKVARKGWNGKGMYIWVMPASTVVGCKNIVDPHLAEIDEEEGMICFLGSIRMRTADGSVLTGWLASQSDMLAEDWKIVEKKGTKTK